MEQLFLLSLSLLGFHRGSAGKESGGNAGDLGSIPGLGRSPREEIGYPRQYSGLEDSMDCIVHGVCKELATTKQLSPHFTSFLDCGCRKMNKMCFCH